jgi:MoaA/NifB/PqqE/SkfB family radical SAM enzyme
MCNNWKSAKPNDELTPQDVENIFGQLDLDVVRISGGEPFVRSDMAEIIDATNVSMPEIIHLTTNGMATNNIIDCVKKCNCADKLHIKVSLEGIGQYHDKIRGVKGAYDKAMKTITKLAKLRDEYNFFLAVNQTISDKKGIEDYKELKDWMDDLGINTHVVLAYSTNTIYNGLNRYYKPDNKIYKLKDVNKQELIRFVDKLIDNAYGIINFKEMVAKLYYLKGIKNRINGNIKPNPKCVALGSHLRILPNGDVPVCLYNSNIVGNLKRVSVSKLYNNYAFKKQRNWVNRCKGCWAGCESILNGAYTGDLWRIF